MQRVRRAATFVLLAALLAGCGFPGGLAQITVGAARVFRLADFVILLAVDTLA